MSEAPQRWQEYRHFSNRLQGDATWKLTVNGALRLHTSYQVKQNDSGKLVVTQNSAYEDSKSLETQGEVLAFNSLYSFSLQRHSETSPWFITGVVKRGENARDRAPGYSEAIRWISGASLGLTNAKALDQLLKQPAFKVVAISEIIDGAAAAVRVEFDNGHHWDEGEFFPIQKGVLILDPQHFWCLRSAKLECIYSTGALVSRVNATYDVRGKGLPIPKKVVDDATSEVEGQGTVRSVSEITYSFVNPTTLPDDGEFTLSAFGFPEPEFAATGSQLYLWIGAVGVLCVVTAIVLRSLLRHRSPAR
ncbi:MAG: hypothetical protein HY000_12025 [Planctomycetes bacterium]|nr:hypothetical protein [Planctomycetota bacterium]